MSRNYINIVIDSDNELDECCVKSIQKAITEIYLHKNMKIIKTFFCEKAKNKGYLTLNFTDKNESYNEKMNVNYSQYI